mgnify:CR=1 FL=1
MARHRHGKPLLTFPTSFSLKAIGRGVEDFEPLVVEIVCKHAGELEQDAVHSRLSSGGKYLAVTVTFTATSRDQLDTIYRELGGHERVVMLL